MPNLPGFAGAILPALVGAALATAVAAGGPAFADPPAPPPAPAGEAAAAATRPAATPTAPEAAKPQPGGPEPIRPQAAEAPPARPAAPQRAAAAAGPLSQPGTGSALIPHDLSPYGMFAHADAVVKAVMIGLGLASLATWTILLAKLVELLAARGTAKRTLETVARADTLREAADGLPKRDAAPARLVEAALAEAERSRGLPAEGVKERAAALLARIEARAGRGMGRGTGLLATVGSVAPFVGLFGTVWGIMNAFIGISRTNTTNLAVVAPGIAEALLATATGLVAAIPAVVIFNFFARGITGYRSLLGDISAEVLRMLSRDLDREGSTVAMGRRAAE